MFHKTKESKLSEWRSYVWIISFLNSMTIYTQNGGIQFTLRLKYESKKEFYATVRKK